jgi:FkbM family methyltransferase
MNVLTISRKVAGHLSYLAQSGKRSIDNDGVLLSLDGMSTRMRKVLLRGGYEREDARLCRKHLRPDSRVLEIGGSIGFVSLFCIKMLGIRHYAVVEANPALIERIAHNYSLNDVRVPPVLNAAVSGEDGRASFRVSEDFWSSSLLERDRTSHVVEVEQMTIDRVIDRLDFVPDTLVMDIEGGEMFIPASHLARFDFIIAELHPHIIGEDKVRALIDGLAEHGLVEVDRDDKTHVFRRDRVGPMQ